MTKTFEFRAEVNHADYPTLPIAKIACAGILAAKSNAYAERAKINDDNARNFLIDFQSRSRSLALASLDQETLEEYLIRLGESLKRDYSDYNAEMVLKNFADDVAEVSCTNCSGRSLHPTGKACHNVRHHDRAILSRGPKCWSPLIDLFASLVALAEDQYRKILVAGKANFKLQVMHHQAEFVGAKTVFGASDSQGERNAIIEISLPLEFFDEAQLKQIPYLMFHEIFVHGPEAWLGSSRSVAGPERTTERCSLREGFVDAAAVEVLTAWLHTKPSSLRSWIELAKQCITRTRGAQYCRSVPAAGLSRSARSGLLHQVQAARESGLALFDDVRLAHGESNAIKLALALNALALTEDERIDLVVYLHAGTPEDAPQRRWLNGLVADAAGSDITAVEATVREKIRPKDQNNSLEF